MAGIEELEHAGEVPEALSQLGLLYLRKVPPDSPAAVAALTKALQLQPNNLKVCVALAELRDQAGVLRFNVCVERFSFCEDASA